MPTPLTLTASRATAALLAAALLAGCATHKPTNTGFLAPRETVAPAAVYTAVIIEPVSFAAGGKIPKTVKDAELTALKADYHAALTKAFGLKVSPTDRPGPGVLRVRAAITGYSLANPAWNVGALIAPIGPRNGGVTTEAEVVDSVTGVRIASLSASFNGQMFNSAPTAMFVPSAHARAGFRRHAEALVARMPESAWAVATTAR